MCDTSAMFEEFICIIMFRIWYLCITWQVVCFCLLAHKEKMGQNHKEAILVLVSWTCSLPIEQQLIVFCWVTHLLNAMVWKSTGSYTCLRFLLHFCWGPDNKAVAPTVRLGAHNSDYGALGSIGPQSIVAVKLCSSTTTVTLDPRQCQSTFVC